MGRYGDIALVSPHERWRENVRIDESGRFELGEIPAGKYSLVGRANALRGISFGHAQGISLSRG